MLVTLVTKTGQLLYAWGCGLKWASHVKHLPSMRKQWQWNPHKVHFGAAMSIVMNRPGDEFSQLLSKYS